VRDRAERRASKPAEAHSATRTETLGASILLTDRWARSEVGTGVNVGGHHLSPGMHPGVGTSGAGQHYGVPQGPLQGTAEGTGDRVHTALGGEAVKRGPQVGDEQTHPTRRQGPGNGPRRYHCRDGVAPAGMSTGNSVPATVPPDGKGSDLL